MTATTTTHAEMLRHRMARMKRAGRKIGKPIDRFLGFPPGLGMGHVYWELFGRWGTRAPQVVSRVLDTAPRQANQASMELPGLPPLTVSAAPRLRVTKRTPHSLAPNAAVSRLAGKPPSRSVAALSAAVAAADATSMAA